MFGLFIIFKLLFFGLLGMGILGLVFRSKPLLVITTALVVLIVGAVFAEPFLIGRHVIRLVHNEEVVGTWTLTSQSIALFSPRHLPTGTQPKYTIVIRADGTCAFDSMTGFWNDSYSPAEGTWELEHGSGFGTPRNTLRLRLHPQPNVISGYELYFTHDAQHHLRLWDWFGDPDDEEFIEYTRTALQQLGIK